MQLSHHANQRARARAVRPDVIELVLREGDPLPQNPDRILLGRKQIARLRAEGLTEPRLLHRAEKAAPLICVVSTDYVITVFRVTRRVGRTRRRGRK